MLNQKDLWTSLVNKGLSGFDTALFKMKNKTVSNEVKVHMTFAHRKVERFAIE